MRLLQGILIHYRICAFSVAGVEIEKRESDWGGVKTHRNRQVSEYGERLVVGDVASETRLRQNNHVLVRSDAEGQSQYIGGQLVEGNQGSELAVATVEAVVCNIVHIAILDNDASGRMHGRGVVDGSKVCVEVVVDVGSVLRRGKALKEEVVVVVVVVIEVEVVVVVCDGNVAVVAVGNAGAKYIVVMASTAVTGAVEANR